jgi:hypothetical protein
MAQLDRDRLLARARVLIEASAELRQKLEAGMDETTDLLEKLECAGKRLRAMRHQRRGDE